MLGFNRRFDNEFIKVKQLVNQGAVGKPHLVKITSRDPQAPPINYVINSGGLFLDMTIHDFDMARFLVDKEVEEVYAKGAVLINPELAKVGDIDTAVITLTYQDGTMAILIIAEKPVMAMIKGLRYLAPKVWSKLIIIYDTHKLLIARESWSPSPDFL